MNMMSARITPRSKLKAALNPRVILVSSKVKNTGPTMKDKPNPKRMALRYSLIIAVILRPLYI